MPVRAVLNVVYAHHIRDADEENRTKFDDALYDVNIDLATRLDEWGD